MYALECKDTHDLLFVNVYSDNNGGLYYELTTEQRTYYRNFLYTSDKSSDLENMCTDEYSVTYLASGLNYPFIPKYLRGNICVVKVGQTRR